MFAGLSAAEFTRDKKVIPRFSAAPRPGSTFFDNTDNAYRNRSRATSIARFSSNNSNVELSRGGIEPAIHLLDPADRPRRRHNQRNQRELGKSRRSRKIAQGSHHRLPSDRNRIRGTAKMNLLNYAISLKQKQLVLVRRANDGAIVACSKPNAFAGCQPGKQSGQQSIFADLAQIHCGTNCGKASAVN